MGVTWNTLKRLVIILNINISNLFITILFDIKKYMY